MNPPTVAQSSQGGAAATALARRDRLGAGKRARRVGEIAERVMAIVAAEKPRSLAAYLPIRSECDCGRSSNGRGGSESPSRCRRSSTR